MSGPFLTVSLAPLEESAVSINIHQATIHDIDIVTPLFDSYRQFYGKASDLALARSFLAERFQHHQSVIFLALDSKKLGVGFTQLYPSFSSTRAARTYILNDLYVAPDARRSGVAALLLKEVARFGRASGAVRLSLSTALSNEPAQKLYQSLGWKRDETFCEYGLVL